MESRLALRTGGLVLFSLAVLPLLWFSRPDAPASLGLASVAETAHMRVARASHTSTMLRSQDS
jgi:hypothetical protein